MQFSVALAIAAAIVSISPAIAAPAASCKCPQPRGYELSRRGAASSCCGGQRSRSPSIHLSTIISAGPASPDVSSPGHSPGRSPRPSGGDGRPSGSSHSNNAGPGQSSHHSRRFDSSAYVARSFEELYDRDDWPVFARWEMEELD